MGAVSATVILTTVYVWCVFSSKASRVGLSAPIVFVIAGFVYAEIFSVLGLETGPEVVKLVAR